MNTFINYLKSVKSEMVYVVWPTKKEAITHSVLVIVISIVTAAVLYFSDSLLANLLDKLINIF